MKTDVHRARFTQMLREIFSELDDSISHWKVTDGARGNIVIASDAKGEAYHVDVMIRDRITPQIAEDLFSRFSKATSCSAIR